MKPAQMVAVAFLVVVAVGQALRLLLRWDVSVNGVAIPLWVSAVAGVLVGGIAGALWRESRSPR